MIYIFIDTCEVKRANKKVFLDLKKCVKVVLDQKIDK